MEYPHRLRVEVVPRFEKETRFLYLIGCQSENDLNLIREIGFGIFFDPVIESLIQRENRDVINGDIVEVTYLPGVTDNVARSAKEALSLLGINAEVFSGKIYINSFDETKANPLIQSINKKTELEDKRFDQIDLPLVHLDHRPEAELINLDLSDEALLNLSDERCLALDLAELKTIKDHFKALGRMPTDVELEILAQTWSEHCKHKIFAANIDYKEEGEFPYKKLGSKTINSLYKSYIKKATKDVESNRKLEWLISVFSDNAGIVRFDENIDLCIKVETHNSPSALDPYGGALTGILGVNRDILGTGMGARPIANTNVFCVGPYSWPKKEQDGFMPKGLMNPAEILKGVHKGVEDGGNKSGIPTVNGAMAFDPCFCGKPLVFCGTVGVLPPQLSSGRPTAGKYARTGDYIVVVGGSVGADGIHGATFSSKELDESPPATAVQIGDPITQKRVGDFLMEARERELYSSITDNGAGGLSSSIGEMAEATGGARLDLSKSPLKYPGLSPWEVMISESQERMSLAVPPEKYEEIKMLALKRNVQLVNLGEFTDSGFFELFWGDKQVGKLSLEFMHDGLPVMKLNAHWDGPRPMANWMPLPAKKSNPTFLQALSTLIADENIASKKYWVEQYDHEVQAATVIRPFQGTTQKSPGDSGVIALAPHGGQKDRGVAISCGMAYGMSHEDPYMMAIYAMDEAVRNCISQGADPEKICLLDNFCWPDPIESKKCPDGAYKLGQLVRTCEGLYDVCLAYGMPLVSGKDSMKNDFRGRNRNGDPLNISIEPTLLVTAMASIDLNNLVTTHFKNAGDLVYYIGADQPSPCLKASVYAKYFETDDLPLGTFDLNQQFEFYKKLNQLMKNQLLNSCHDISEGGAAVAMVESCFSGEFGIQFDTDIQKNSFLFNEKAGTFIVTVSPENQDQFEKSLDNYFCKKVAIVTDDGQLEYGNEKIPVNDLYRKWLGPWTNQSKGELK